MKKLNAFLVGICSALVTMTAVAGRAAAPSHNLQQELAASTNLRAFALKAMARPAEGGLYYASYVANSCSRDFSQISRVGNAAVAKEIASKSTVSSSRLSMMSDLPQRCGSFVPGEAAEMQAGLKERASRGGDPLVTAEAELIAAWKSGSRDRMRAAVQRLIEIDDPLLWTQHRLNHYVSQFDSEPKRRSAIFLDGKVYTESDGKKAVEANIALDLGFCKVDLPCALDDELLAACAGGGECAADREQRAKQYLFSNGGTEENWKNVVRLVSQIRAALDSQNVSFFIR
jgi:hypothetical protein